MCKSKLCHCAMSCTRYLPNGTFLPTKPTAILSLRLAARYLLWCHSPLGYAAEGWMPNDACDSWGVQTFHIWFFLWSTETSAEVTPRQDLCWRHHWAAKAGSNKQLTSALSQRIRMDKIVRLTIYRTSHASEHFRILNDHIHIIWTASCIHVCSRLARLMSRGHAHPVSAMEQVGTQNATNLVAS